MDRGAETAGEGREAPRADRREGPALLVAALLALALGAGPARAAERAELAESEWLERCFELQAGDAIHYSFTASQAVDFDLHYHSGEATRYPVKRPDATAARGAYTVRETSKYCLYWGNRGAGTADLSVEVRVVRR